MDKAKLEDLRSHVNNLNAGVTAADRSSGDPTWFRFEVVAALDALITAIADLSPNTLGLDVAASSRPLAPYEPPA